MSTDKFKALVHFYVDECQYQPSKLGATRLNKALWYADIISFKINGISITGECYVKRAKGPVPKFILATLNELAAEGKIVIKEPEYRYDTRKYFAIKPADTGSLSDDERSLARNILGSVCGYTADGISNLSHDIVWDAARIGEEIPIYATLASNEGEISDTVLKWANGQIEAAA